MLIKFAVKNFRGFAERIEWDLSHPCNYSFNTYAVKEGVIKNGIIYGPKVPSEKCHIISFMKFCFPKTSSNSNLT